MLNYEDWPTAVNDCQDFCNIEIMDANPETVFAAPHPVVDIHTHVYPPSYMKLLQARSKVPYARTFAPEEGLRLIILPGEDDSSMPSTSRGRPVGPDYFDIRKKISFMDQHGIDVSVISLANPWLDFLDPEDALSTAKMINNEINGLCAKYPGRLWAFGALPLSAAHDDIVAEIIRLHGLPYIRGFIMGTGGIGQGLDDQRLHPIYEAIQKTGLPIFLHPHYGLPIEVFGPRASEYGHVLPLALGFPLETTIAISRMILCGVWDKFKDLKVLVAHSGGTLPFLAGRLESCIAHDNHLKKEDKIGGRRSIDDILRKNIYLDAVIYSATGLEAAVKSSGSDRVLFGTDHPFFPPLDTNASRWPSVDINIEAVKKGCNSDQNTVSDILGRNAIQILRLKL